METVSNNGIRADTGAVSGLNMIAARLSPGARMQVRPTAASGAASRNRPYRLDQLDRLILGPRAPPTQGRANASAILKNPAENPAKTDPC